jgi:hypothetical protein
MNMMKCVCLVSLTSLAVILNLYAGEEESSSKETAPPRSVQSFYRDTEWNVDLFGTLAYTNTDYKNDRFLEVDHAAGGGVDVKFFFNRYFGLGLQGYLLSAARTVTSTEGHFVSVGGGNGFPRTTFFKDRRTLGSVSGTFTLRYPIAGSRAAPYVYAAGGMIFGGEEHDIFTIRPTPPFFIPNDYTISTEHTGGKTEAVGQFGGGIELRLTPHVGIISDFSWNVVNGRRNNFGMARTGINFAF